MLDVLYAVVPGMAILASMEGNSFSAYLTSADDMHWGDVAAGSHHLRYRLGVTLEVGSVVAAEGKSYVVRGTPMQINAGEMRANLVLST
jgi:hypothetical protein